ncbi:MAG: C10 family peptidase [Prevotellaceae bacterium]|nr:C10 family peptidase [Prevotellaceae bacterium]
MRSVFILLLLASMPCLAQHKVRQGEAVLAYDLQYDPASESDSMPDALRELLRAYKAQPRYAERTQGKAVEPLLKSVRSQYAPFNNSCPYYTYSDGTQSAERCVTGCVATCLEQVLSYWKHPEALLDTLHGWETEHYVIDDVLPGTRIDWDNILDDYSAGYTDEQARAVADLTYYCGVAAEMSWGTESSGASLFKAFEPLWSAFDYETIAFLQRALYSNEAWNRMLRNELECGRPICYTGYNMALSGHAFNIDGVDEQGYYHINWGYSGHYDGYYDLDYLNPFEQYSDPTELGRNEGFFSNQTAMFLHPDDFVIDVFDTLSTEDALAGVRVDTITFRREPDTQGYVEADFHMTNTTRDSLYFTFEVLTFLPTDTAIFQQADYVALSSVCLAPLESKTWPVYCQFTETGERIMSLSTDDVTLPYQQQVSIAQGISPQLVFGEVTHQLVTYGDNLTATLSLDVTNEASGGYAGNLVTYCLFPKGAEIDQRHWDVLSVAGGETVRQSCTFQHLEDGVTYTLYIRCPWTIQRTYTFTAKREEALDRIDEPSVVEGGRDDDAWYDLQGRRVERPVRGLYVKHGKKILIR